MGLRIRTGVGDDPTMASWLEESLGLLARGLLADWVYISGSCREGSAPSGPNDMGSGGDLTSAPSFPFLIYSPAPACRLGYGASWDWEG